VLSLGQFARRVGQFSARTTVILGWVGLGDHRKTR
jgi:hypothetical protein